MNIYFHCYVFLEYRIYNLFISQTIKCLLIVPNAESALNEEAGKLLLEQYEDYFQRAKMMTEIHAQVGYELPMSELLEIFYCVNFSASENETLYRR